MITIDLTDYRRMAEKVVPELRRQIPFALSVALNRTANAAKASQLAEVQTKLDRPTTYITKGFWINYSSKENLEARLGPELFGTTSPAEILAVQEVGGSRKMKRSERRLGSYWVPSMQAPRDSHGNISGSSISEMLAALKYLEPEQWRKNKNLMRRIKRGESPREFFQNGNVIYQIMGKGKFRTLRPFIILVAKAPSYHKRIDFAGQNRAVAEEVFPSMFAEAFAMAVATAKKP